jgi:hypothetical protein
MYYKFKYLGRNTRYGFDIHQTISNLSVYRRGAYHTGLKVFNSLPTYIICAVAQFVEALCYKPEGRGFDL